MFRTLALPRPGLGQLSFPDFGTRTSKRTGECGWELSALAQGLHDMKELPSQVRYEMPGLDSDSAHRNARFRAISKESRADAAPWPRDGDGIGRGSGVTALGHHF